ncbi:TPA: TauD/TfdA family dioxygenase [Salmonella enterica subsp. enterica serovar Bovismorbificans]
MNNVTWKRELESIAKNIDENIIRKSINIASLYLDDVERIRYNLDCGCGYHIINNVPIDSVLPPPPLSGLRPYDKTYISELALSGITGALGYNLFSYEQEKKGSFFHEITPIKGKEKTKSSNGVIDFSFHTDAAYLDHNLRPEVLALICLNNECNTGTQIVSLELLLKELETSTINTLKSNNFIIRSPDSFDVRQESQTAILYENDDRTEIQLSIEVTTPLTEKAKKSLMELTELANQIADTLMWKPGDFLIFNNRRTLHGRKAIQGVRWLQRCYGSQMIPAFTKINLIEDLNHE